MEQTVMEAQAREPRGKGGARSMRRAGEIPAVVYGAHKETLPISVRSGVVEKILRSAHGHNVILTLSIKGKGKTPAMIRDWQVDPVRGTLLHVDFLRIAMDEAVRVKVAVHFTGEPVGVKQEGGHMEVVTREVEIECLPGDIPEEFLVDVAPLKLHDSFRVSDLSVDEAKLQLQTDASQILVHVVPPRVVEEETPAEEEVVAAEPTEPEVAKRGKAEEGEAAPDEKKDKKEKKE